MVAVKQTEWLLSVLSGETVHFPGDLLSVKTTACSNTVSPLVQTSPGLGLLILDLDRLNNQQKRDLQFFQNENSAHMPCDKTKGFPFMEQLSGYSQRHKHKFRSWLKACCQRRCRQAGNSWKLAAGR